MNRRIPIIIGILMLLFGGFFGIYESISDTNVIEGIVAGLLLGLIPMGWNELMTIKEEDVNDG